jgi:hypothetical protein
MPSQQDSESATPQLTPKPHWWWHDDDYVANDSWNWLAVAETVAAICLYFWIASKSPWPWLTAISFVAVPLLLLKSEGSIERGIELLQSITSDRPATKSEGWPTSIISIAVGSSLSWWLVGLITQPLLNGHSSWALYGRCAAIGVITGAIAMTVALAVALALSGARNEFRKSIAIAMVVATVMAGASVGLEINLATGIIGSGYTVLFGAFIFLSASATVLMRIKKISASQVRGMNLIYTLLFVPSFLIGFCLMGLIFRLRATLTVPHLKAGTVAFSKNWYETVLVSNMRHAPALLPGAGRVNHVWNVATLTLNIKLYPFHRIFTGGLGLAIFLVATIYRWNIKANSWIWWPLYLLLRPVQWEKHPLAPEGLPSDQRRANSALWSNSRIFIALGSFIVMLLGYLIYPHIPKDLQALQHGWVAVINTYTPSNWQSLRYWLAVVLLLALCQQVVFSFKMSVQYQEQLAKSEAHQKMTPDVEDAFDKAANKLIRSRWLTFACFLLLVYALAIKFAVQTWPNTWGIWVWSWLKAVL